MPLFRVSARDAQGGLRISLIEAESSAAATGQVREKGLYAFDCSPYDADRTDPGLSPLRLALAAIDPQSLALLFRHLAALLKAGVTPSTALGRVSTRLPDRRLAAACAAMARDIDQGATLSATVASRRGVFPDWVAGALAAAEGGGRYDAILTSIHAELREDARFATRFAVPLSYLRAAAVLAVLVPTLPFLITRSVADWAMIAGMVGAVAVLAGSGCGVLWRLKRLRRGSPLLPGGLGLLPSLRAMYRELALRRFVRILVGLQESGLRPYDAWVGACPAIGDASLERSAEAGGGALAAGGGMCEAFRLTGLFEADVLEAAAASDSSGGYDAFHQWLIERADSRTDSAVRAGVRGVWSALLIGAAVVVLLGFLLGAVSYMGNLAALITQLFEDL